MSIITDVITRALKLAVAVGALTVAFAAGKESGFDEATEPHDIAECDDNDLLGGLSWRVDLTQSLLEQNCATHDAFPGKILCEREVTIECDIPKGSVISE